MGEWRKHPTGPYRELGGDFRPGLYREPGHSTSKYRRHFSESDEAVIKQMIERGCRIADVVAVLNRSYSAVKAHANRVMKVQFKFPPKGAA
jgi:hypothetical protein